MFKETSLVQKISVQVKKLMAWYKTLAKQQYIPTYIINENNSVGKLYRRIVSPFNTRAK